MFKLLEKKKKQPEQVEDITETDEQSKYDLPKVESQDTVIMDDVAFFPKKPKEKKPSRFKLPKRKLRKPNFSLKGNFPIFEFLIKGGPMVIMKNADRSIEILKAKRLEGKFFQTKFGTYELDGEYELRFDGVTSYYIYNLKNSKPVSLKGIETIQRFYREKKADVLVHEVNRIKQAVDSMDYLDPIAVMDQVFESTEKSKTKLTQDEIKFLVDYITYNPSDVKLFNNIRKSVKRPSFSYSKDVNTMFPILIIAGIGIGIVLLLRFFNPLLLFDIPI